jgi:hypothetical protein
MFKIKYIGYRPRGVDWIKLTQDGIECRTLVSTGIKLRDI